MMGAGWLAVSLLLAPAVTAAVALLARSRLPDPAIIVLNALVPGAGLAAAKRPLIEVVMGVLFCQVSLILVGGPGELGLFLPIMLIGGFWASVYTDLSPQKLLAAIPEGTAPAGPAGTRGGTSPTVGAGSPDAPPQADVGYAVVVRCTECGADVEVPVLHRMAQCTFCGSYHLVVGHDDILQLAVPARVNGAVELRRAVLDHYRYVHYLALYKRHVRPLVSRAEATAADGGTTPQLEAAVQAAEAAASRRADAYRAKLDAKLRLGEGQSFLAPYWHGMGCLYQTAFGRDPQSMEKELRFAIGAIEASTIANAQVELPKMGKLSYLRALVPAASCPAAARALPVERDLEDLLAAFGDLDRKQLVRGMQVIRLGSVFSEETRAVVWRPFWVVQAEGGGVDDTLLVDGAAASVVGSAPYLNPEILEDLPKDAREAGGGLRFSPMECPTCGHEFPYHHDAVAHFCSNCHRLFTVDHGRKVEHDYDHVAHGMDDRGADLVPFWAFELKLHTTDGRVVTDLMHLRDGIDGVLDQIGEDAVEGQDTILVPAIRVINPKLWSKAFTALFRFATGGPLAGGNGRIPLDQRVSPWPVCLEEREARTFAPIYLGNAFGRRDLAKANVEQINAWLFDAKLQSRGVLTYVPVPRGFTEPFRRYVGRVQGQALRRAEGR